MDTRLVKPRALIKPTSLLKDHLLDDMSSCSSNGFKSFPRRQCCSTVPFFPDVQNLKNRQQQQRKITAKSSAISAIQSVIAAVKRFPFSAEKNGFRSSFLSRNFSKKILSRSSFWKRSKSKRKQIQRWVLYDNLLVNDPEPSDLSDGSITTSDSKSKSWSGSDFTVSDDCSSGNFSSEVKLNLPKGENDVVEQGKSGEADGGVAMDSTACNSDGSVTTEKQWSNGEKEQLSPVSVLDCPFEDEDEDEISSPFDQRLTRMEGTKKKLMMKIQKFESLTQLEPLNLSRRFSSVQDAINEPVESSLSDSHSSTDEKFVSDIEEEHREEKEKNQVEEKALELLNRTMDTLPSYNDFKLYSNELLLDFFREKIININENSEKQREGSSYDEELLEEAKDWINGQKTRAMFLEWNVHKNRQVYINDMEKRGEWKILDEENKEVALELEIEVFGDLLDELLLEILA